MLLFTLFTLFSIINSTPIASCKSQSSCLEFTIGNCDINRQRSVCVKWNPSVYCEKATTFPTAETVSHSCAGYTGYKGLKDQDGDGDESWSADSPICVTVNAGEDAIFGIKDGVGCSDAGSYMVNGLTESVVCNGPKNVCEGNNKKECAWIVSTETCTDDPQDIVCPSDLECSVKLPCTVLHEGKDCECHSYKFIA
ncbi:hypothetical protein OAF54_03700 [bacterium]|nr:hypothetical protein [bacterium]